MKTKKCTRCFQAQRLEEFKHYGSVCRICKNTRSRERYKEDPELRARLAARDKVWRNKNIERYRERYRKRKSNALHKEKRRAYQIKKRYKLDYQVYLSMKQSQLNKCAICLLERNLHVDHCHKTGKVRGLLCRNCNYALGLLQDNKVSVKRILSYL